MRRLGQARPWVGIVSDATGVSLATTETAQHVADLAEARRQCPPSDHRFVTAISGADVWCHTLMLPSTDTTELEQMARLQLDDLSPLPTEEIVCGFLPLERTETHTRLLLAIAPKAIVNERVAALETAGLPVEVVGVDALAVFRAMVRCHRLPQEERLHLFVWRGTDSVSVIGFLRGQPLWVRSMKVANPDELVGEIRQTRLAMEWAQPGVPFGEVMIAGADEAWRGKLGASARFITDGEVPTVAAALREETTAERGGTLNLLPDEWRQQRRAARLRRRLAQGALVVAAVYALALLGFGAAWVNQQQHLREIDRQRKSLQTEYAEAREARQTLTALESRFDTKQTALEALREITLLLPEKVQLTGFGFKKGHSVTLRGETPSASLASDFIGRLERCPLFTGVKTVSMPTVQGGLTKFEVVCSLKSAARPAGAKP